MLGWGKAEPTIVNPSGALVSVSSLGNMLPLAGSHILRAAILCSSLRRLSNLSHFCSSAPTVSVSSKTALVSPAWPASVFHTVHACPFISSPLTPGDSGSTVRIESSGSTVRTGSEPGASSGSNSARERLGEQGPHTPGSLHLDSCPPLPSPRAAQSPEGQSRSLSSILALFK